MRAAFGVLLLTFAAWPAAAQEAVSIEDFFGTWRGQSVADTAAPLDLEPGALDVTIEPEDDGFRVRWVSLDGDPAESAFAPADRPGLYETERPGRLLRGERLRWARFDDGVLSIVEVVADPVVGYDLVSWDRTVEGDEMAIVIRRLRGGELIRGATGLLVRSGR